jgi:hypothetical protein
MEVHVLVPTTAPAPVESGRVQHAMSPSASSLVLRVMAIAAPRMFVLVLMDGMAHAVKCPYVISHADTEMYGKTSF